MHYKIYKMYVSCYIYNEVVLYLNNYNTVYIMLL